LDQVLGHLDPHHTGFIQRIDLLKYTESGVMRRQNMSKDKRFEYFTGEVRAVVC
jgi:hypothetical protein